jgi:hypothetical protein
MSRERMGALKVALAYFTMIHLKALKFIQLYL